MARKTTKTLFVCQTCGYESPKWMGRCTECGECLPRCPEKLDIPGLLFDAHDLLKTGSGRRLWG